VRKGEETRQTILTHALGLATQVGFEGLTIGRLAGDLRMSKSGLFAHFQAKEALQVQVLQMAADRFVQSVVRPALAVPRGEPRVRALFERWLAWEASPSLPGGCPFMAAAIELDDRPGPARDYLVQSQRDWHDTIGNTVKTAIAEGHFRADVSPEQFAHDLMGVMFAYHHASRLMRDPKASERAQAAFGVLVGAARARDARHGTVGARETGARPRRMATSPVPRRSKLS
jgi:AcrR family transcriptional regulator